jgi:hypothetical protein
MKNSVKLLCALSAFAIVNMFSFVSTNEKNSPINLTQLSTIAYADSESGDVCKDNCVAATNKACKATSSVTCSPDWDDKP